jgi:hypothetical protein
MEPDPKQRRMDELESLFANFISQNPGKTIFTEQIFKYFDFMDLYYLARSGNSKIKEYFITNRIWYRLLEANTDVPYERLQEWFGADELARMNPLWMLLAIKVYTSTALNKQLVVLQLLNDQVGARDNVTIQRVKLFGQHYIFYRFTDGIRHIRDTLLEQIPILYTNSTPDSFKVRMEDVYWNLRRTYVLFELKLAITFMNGTNMPYISSSAIVCAECMQPAKYQCSNCMLFYCKTKECTTKDCY